GILVTIPPIPRASMSPDQSEPGRRCDRIGPNPHLLRSLPMPADSARCFLAGQQNPLACPRDTRPGSTVLPSPSGSGSFRVLPALLPKSRTPYLPRSPLSRRESDSLSACPLSVVSLPMIIRSPGSSPRSPVRYPARTHGSCSLPLTVSARSPPHPRFRWPRVDSHRRSSSPLLLQRP